MIVTTYRNADAFLDRTQKTLEVDEAANNLLLGVCRRLKRFPEKIESEPYLIAVEDSRGIVMAAAALTPSRKIVVFGDRSQLVDASATIIKDLIARNWTVPGVEGPSEAARIFAETWTRISGGEHQLTATRRVYQLTEVAGHFSTLAGLRAATDRDIELLTRWIHAFHKETGRQGDLIKAYRIAKNLVFEGDVFIWQENKPMSTTAKIRTTSHGVTLNYVYTPYLFRRKGYATACLAGLSKMLINLGWKFCFIIADPSSPEFFHELVEKVGFVPVCDYGEYRFLSGQVPDIE